MTTHSKQYITDAEWEVMRIVWANGPLASREIINHLLDIFPWKEGTIKSLINRLVQKEVLGKVEGSKPFRYQATIQEKDAITKELDTYWERVCHKDSGKLLHHLIETKELSQSDITTLMQVLEAKRETAPKEVACQCPVGQCRCHL